MPRLYCLRWQGLTVSTDLDVLNTLPPTREGAKKLLYCIFMLGECDSSAVKSLSASGKLKVPRMLSGMVPLLTELLSRHQRHQYHFVLQRHCPLPEEAKAELARIKATLRSRTRDAAGPERFAHLLRFFSESHNVAAFLKSLCFTVLPKALWGSKHNRQVILDAVHRLVHMTRHEQMSVHQVMHSFKVTECRWLYAERPASGKRNSGGPLDAEVRVECVGRLVLWIFSCYMIPLLRSVFYCTETAAHHNRIFFINKHLWSVVFSVAMHHLKHDMLQQLSEQQATEILNSRLLGYAFVRMVPKLDGIRPIINLSRYSYQFKAKSINSMLQNVFSVMSNEKMRQPQLVGASVFGFDEIYAKLVHLVRQWRRPGDSAAQRPLFFVSVDIKRCFDQLNQAKLYSVVEQLFSPGTKEVRKFVEIGSFQGRVMPRFRRVVPESIGVQFTSFSKELCKTVC